jgi:Nucleotidyl transferase AbiEii toxin, Type IV TA system
VSSIAHLATLHRRSETSGALDSFPTLLGGPTAVLLTYPRETVVAEKFEAIVKLGMANTRMKDFCDFTPCRLFSFEGRILSEALVWAFERRKTRLPSAPPIAFTAEFLMTNRNSASGTHSTIRTSPISSPYCSNSCQRYRKVRHADGLRHGSGRELEPRLAKRRSLARPISDDRPTYRDRFNRGPDSMSRSAPERRRAYFRQADLSLPIAPKLVNIGFVKEGAFSNHEVARGESMIQSECGMRHPRRHLKEEDTHGTFPRRNLLRQP